MAKFCSIPSPLLLVCALLLFVCSFRHHVVASAESKRATSTTPHGECIPLVETQMKTTTTVSDNDIHTEKEQAESTVPSFYCLDNIHTGEHCIDSHEMCSDWAKRGECRKNPSYMVSNCRKSCRTCLDLHSTSHAGGELQVSPSSEHARAILERLVETQAYIYRAMERDPNVMVKCRNEHEMCTYWALRGECGTNVGFMSVSCSAACHTCG